MEPVIDSNDDSRADAHFFFSSMTSFVDVSVVHPAAPSYVKQSHRPLFSATTREKQKDGLYLQRATAQGASFFPFVVESFGAIGKKAQTFISKLRDEALANGVTDIEGLPVKSFLTRSLSFSLQLGNALLLLEGSRSARAKLRQT